MGQILKAVNDRIEVDIGVPRATIMNKVYLSSAHMNEYLKALTVHGLLNYDSTMHRYHITDKGLKYLGLYDKISEVIKEDEEHTLVEYDTY